MGNRIKDCIVGATAGGSVVMLSCGFLDPAVRMLPGVLMLVCCVLAAAAPAAGTAIQTGPKKQPSILILRGLPGSGKSTFGKQLAELTESLEGADHYEHYEADMCFVGADGVYRYDARRIGMAHAWCLASCKAAIRRGHSVVVANTFSRAREYEPYMRLGVPALVTACGGCYGSTHGVPYKVVETMREGWQPHVPDDTCGVMSGKEET